MHDTSDITETRHLISIFLKLSSLSQSVEPRSETKWLTRAIRESIRLIPFLKGVNMSDYAQLLSDLEPFSGKEASFSELLNELAVQTKDKKDLTPVTEGDQVVPSAQVITADEVLDAEEVFPLPKWHVRDVISAIAIPLEKVGQYADKQGRRECVFLSPYRLLSQSALLVKSRIVLLFVLTHWHNPYCNPPWSPPISSPKTPQLRFGPILCTSCGLRTATANSIYAT